LKPEGKLLRFASVPLLLIFGERTGENMYQVFAKLAPDDLDTEDVGGGGYCFNDDHPQRVFQTHSEEIGRAFRIGMEHRFPAVKYELHQIGDDGTVTVCN
jgi:hypothetical protein